MASFDRITGSYALDTYNGDITITSDYGQGDIYLYGNVWVIGTWANVKSVDTLIDDNIVSLSANTTGIPVLNSGIEVIRGDYCTVGLRWTEAVDRWQLTDDCYHWANIMIRVEDDPDPHLGGNLYTTGVYHSNTNWEIRSLAPHNIVFSPGWDGASPTTAFQINHNPPTASLPTTVANATVLYFAEPQAGRSGVYVAGHLPCNSNDELITKRKAVAYSLLL